jgi:uncharacterized protein YdhG (YjbR/CyaY superfamily)
MTHLGLWHNGDMSTFSDYLITIENPKDKAELERMCKSVHDLLPEVEEGTSYGMPAFIYKGKAFFSFAVTKKFLSIYPFSSQIVTDFMPKLGKYETTKGSIHFSVENPISDELLKELLLARVAMITD